MSSKKREALLKKALLSLVQSSSSSSSQGGEAAGAAKQSIEALFSTSGDAGGAATGKRKASKADGDKAAKKAKGGDSSSSSSSKAAGGQTGGKGKKAPAVSLFPPVRHPEEGNPSTEATMIINRAPVLTLWVALVAYRKTKDWPYSLSVGRAFADAIATAKGASIGVFGKEKVEEAKKALQDMPGLREEEFMGKAMVVKDTDEGVVALNNEGQPCQAPQAQTYLHKAFKERYDHVCQAMMAVTESYEDVEELEGRAYHMYECFRPQVPKGTAGWGQKSTLSLAAIRQQAKQP